MTDETKYKVEPDVLRYKLTKLMPYFSDVIYRLRPRVQEGLGTFAIDARFNWYYDTEVPFTPDEQVAVLFHEINHGIRNHHGRAGDRDPKKWNIAGDREINDWFPNELNPPENAIGSKKYGMNDLDLPDHELAEWYFDRIEKYDQHIREDANAMSAGTGPCKSHPGCDSQDTEPLVDAKTFDVKQRGKLHTPICGGIAGNPGENEDQSESGGGVSEVEAESIRQSVAEKVMAEAKKGRGNLPGALVDWANQLLNPIVPWQKLLKTAAARAATIIAGDQENTFQRPARRSPPRLLLPKRINRKTTAAFYIDTSGSMSDEEINQAISETVAALRTNLADMTINFVDAEVHASVKAKGNKYRVPQHMQRGGTDMNKCFEHAKTLNPLPNLVIVMTDGETPWPAEPNRGMRTIIVLTRHARGSNWGTPDWAWKVIHMDPKEDEG